MDTTKQRVLNFRESREMEESWGSGYKEYVAGLIAGLATVIVGHPFDTVKVKH